VEQPLYYLFPVPVGFEKTDFGTSLVQIGLITLRVAAAAAVMETLFD